MKTFNQWLATANMAIQSLPEMTVRAIFEAGQDNPDIQRVGKVAYMCELNGSAISNEMLNSFWEQSK